MGTPNPRPDRIEVGAGATLVTIYGKGSELFAYLDGLTEVAVPAAVVSNQSVNGHGRRRYPGGPQASVAGHSRSRIIERPLPDQTLPGKNAWIERKVGDNTVVEQFTFVGDFQDLMTYCKAEAKVAFVLRSPNGAAYPISAPA